MPHAVLPPPPESGVHRRGCTRHLAFWLTALFVPAFSGCDAYVAELVAPPESPTAQQEEQPSPGLITSAAEEFAAAVRAVDNRNRIMILIKDSQVPRVSSDRLADLPLEREPVVALAEPDSGESPRVEPGLPTAGDDAFSAIFGQLRDFGIEPVHPRRVFPVVTAEVPDSVLEAVVSRLLDHPNVDYLEASRSVAVTPDGALAPDGAAHAGSNPTDLKHDLHDVEDAWVHTQGEGVKVGILDSGIAGSWDGSDKVPHEDLEDSGSYGVRTLGFATAYTSGCSNPKTCEWRDDHGHGTFVVGLAGANDNDLGYVGTMPLGTTFSAKIAHNPSVSGSSCTSSWGDTLYCIDTSDFVDAANWASSIALDVLAMPFSGSFGSTALHDALYDAYHTYDVLLLSSTGNNPLQSREPQKWSFVMGVGCVLSDLDTCNTNQEYMDVSAYGRGWTTRAGCGAGQFCTPSDYVNASPFETSWATGTTTGIAGLVRSAYASWTAPQIRSRLIQSSQGDFNTVNAREAIEGPPLTVTIIPVDGVKPDQECTWVADVTGGSGSRSYQWHRDGTPVGTDSLYSGNTGTDPDFQLRVDVSDTWQSTWDIALIDVSDWNDDC